MSFNSSRFSENWCLEMFPKPYISSTNYHVTLASCVVAAILAPMAMAGNALILAAIWRSPSLRTPSYVLVAGLAVTDFCTGLLTQPLFIVRRMAEITENAGGMFCIAGFAAHSVAYYFASLTVGTIMLIAVERWLHMSRRSLLTVHRVVIFCTTSSVLLIAVVAGCVYTRYRGNKTCSATVLFLAGAVCVSVTGFAYFRVFQIIRHHQNQVQTNPSIRHHQNQVQSNTSAIDMRKYKRSIFTILYILAIFVLSYVPFLCCVLVFSIFKQDSSGKVSFAAYNACSTVVFSSSFFNPLLYYWRIKEIREGVRSIIRKLFCWENKGGNHNSH